MTCDGGANSRFCRGVPPASLRNVRHQKLIMSFSSSFLMASGFDISCHPGLFGGLVHETLYLLLQFHQVFRLALPDHHNSPAESLERGNVLPVPLNVLVELVLPKLLIRRGSSGSPALEVSMPEAAVNEYDFLVFRQADIRVSGEVSTMNSKPIAHFMKQGSDDQFRLRVLSSNPGHYPASFFLAEDVHSNSRIGLREARGPHRPTGRQVKEGRRCLFAWRSQFWSP